MKLGLEEARKRATQTKLRVKEGTADIREAEGPRTIAFAFSTREGEEQVYNAALLAHVWNHFDELLAAVEEERDARIQFELGWRLDTARLEKAQEALAAALREAREVELP